MQTLFKHPVMVCIFCFVKNVRLAYGTQQTIVDRNVATACRKETSAIGQLVCVWTDVCLVTMETRVIRSVLQTALESAKEMVK